MKPTLEFYDIKLKNKFSSGDWRIEVKDTKAGKRYFAVTKVPGEEREAWLIVKKDFAMSHM